MGGGGQAWCRAEPASPPPDSCSRSATSLSELRTPGWAMAPLPLPHFLTPDNGLQFLTHFSQENAPETPLSPHSVSLSQVPPEPPHVPARARPLIQGSPSWRWAVWSWCLRSKQSGHCWARTAANPRSGGRSSAAAFPGTTRWNTAEWQALSSKPALAPSSSKCSPLSCRDLNPAPGFWSPGACGCTGAPLPDRAQLLPSSEPLLKPVPFCEGP